MTYKEFTKHLSEATLMPDYTKGESIYRLLTDIKPTLAPKYLKTLQEAGNDEGILDLIMKHIESNWNE